ncbi:MAG: four helix bundle protein [Planctomycetes bacterium]|nr:four helix bundle protein [Planctomycetota bacterium]
MRIEKFEDLECWKRARIVTKKVYTLTKPKGFASDYRLRDQITGASVSIMNNMAEGFDSQSNREFVRFLTYARRSVSEVQNCLYVALDQNYIDEATFKELYNECTEVRKITDGLMRYLRSKTKRS